MQYDEKYYLLIDEIQIQATIKLPDNSNREIENLSAINDFNHKYVVTTNRNDV